MTDVQDLERLLGDIKIHHEKLFNDNKKKSCTECRRHLQSMAVLCKSMRKSCLEHKATISVAKRKAKPPADEEKKEEIIME